MEVIINGKKYSARPTMGAMVRYKRLTGKEITTIKTEDVSDLIAFVYCCVVSAANADKVPFDMSFEDFADALDPGDLADFTAEQTAVPAAPEEKKTD